MRVLFINNGGGGFADKVSMDEGISVESFVENNVEGDPNNFIIRVNRNAVTKSQVLHEGDTITVTPAKIEGN